MINKVYHLYRTIGDTGEKELLGVFSAKVLAEVTLAAIRRRWRMKRDYLKKKATLNELYDSIKDTSFYIEEMPIIGYSDYPTIINMEPSLGFLKKQIYKNKQQND